jgi:hypothetical protein
MENIWYLLKIIRSLDIWFRYEFRTGYMAAYRED